MKIDRRSFLPLAGAGLLAGYADWRYEKSRPRPPAGKSPVVIIRARSYSTELAQRMLDGVKQCGLDVRGRKVLLKPNLVEVDTRTCINTDVSVLAAALEVFHQLGAEEVWIGEGPGHRRDTADLARMARYSTEVPGFDKLFVDLNRDDVSRVAGFDGLGEIYLPNTALRADLVVSLAKMKTHHWAGVTLAMKNFFGLVPGAVYGWPKNTLHQVGIDRSVVELNRIFRRSFAIVDGIVGMEGNGPTQGEPKPCGVLVMGGDLVAVDATCCRIMGVDPRRVGYLSKADTLGHLRPAMIDQRGETIRSVRTNFDLMEPFRYLRLA